MAENLEKLKDATLAILAGGQGTRMGKPKGELLIGGQPILSYLRRRIEWPGPTMLVTAPGREHPPGWEQFGMEVTDAQPLGPLGGILTALQSARRPMVVVLTVDMPGIDQSHIHWLLQNLESQPRLLGVMPLRNTASSRQIEPFPSLYRREAIDIIRQRLNSGRRSVLGLTEENQFLAVPAPKDWPDSTWTNLNSPADLAAFLNK